MSKKLRQADFYYGAVLSMLFNNHINPVLVEGDDDRQVYDLTTNNAEFRLFIKYRTEKQKTKKDDYNSWLFTITDSDKKEVLGYIDSGYNILVVLLCGVEDLAESEIAFLNKDEIKQIIDLRKTSISISRKKNERAFRISLGDGRPNSMQIKTNRFDELFYRDKVNV